MMKKPDEIKKGLADNIAVHYHPVDLEPRLTPLIMCDLEAMHADALALIQQLESKLECSQMTIDGLTTTLLKSDTIIKQLQAERDAAVKDIKQMVQAPYEPAYCEYCKKTEEECAKVNCWRRDQFEWRGVQKEDGNA